MCFPKLVTRGSSSAVNERFKPKGLVGESCGTLSGVLAVQYANGVDGIEDRRGRIGEDAVWRSAYARFAGRDEGVGDSRSYRSRVRFDIGLRMKAGEVCVKVDAVAVVG